VRVKIQLLLVLFLPVIALGADPMAPTQTPTEHVAEGLKPYDRLGRDNVTVRAEQKGGGSSTDYNYRSKWGTYVRTVTSTKDIEVTIAQPRKEKQPLKLEFFFVIKGDSKRYAKQAGMLDLPEGEGSAVFSATAKQGQKRWVFVGYREKSGEKIEGWLVRVLNNARIVGIAASSPSLEETASYPDKLKILLAAE
jgi:hypothetical protein